ncbi:hypothetical protein EJ04DRAFT_496148 [Polyplosphaeria fusca]|uniref:Uncharacterized protein n=1 Tax=Polyplosphaeria fusca TaxID=682080 RepID=A0A9P4UYA4_9PLEO|nr:hypothetical protein EJ04DRAFT_496148 [Polyplosphaeria fusca]
MSSSWLQRKRKGELMELANRAGLPDTDDLLKDDLVHLLYDHLESNPESYAKQDDFRDFFKRTGSPIKRESRSSPSEVAIAKPRRRQTKVFENADSEEPTPDKALVTRTPRVMSRVTSRMSNVDLPASPAQVAELADQSFKAAKTKANEWWQEYIETALELVRENASSVTVIQLLLLFVEGVSLEYNTIVTTHAFTFPAVSQLSTYSHPVYLPDMTLLLSQKFWAPAALWSLTSWVLPLIASYFFNLTLRTNTRHKSSNRQYSIDPFTFNLVKAVLAYSAYSCAIGLNVTGAEAVVCNNPAWGPFSGPTVNRVRGNVLGQYYGLQISAVIGLLSSLYDAVLKS